MHTTSHNISITKRDEIIQRIVKQHQHIRLRQRQSCSYISFYCTSDLDRRRALPNSHPSDQVHHLSAAAIVTQPLVSVHLVDLSLSQGSFDTLTNRPNPKTTQIPCRLARISLSQCLNLVDSFYLWWGCVAPGSCLVFVLYRTI